MSNLAINSPFPEEFQSSRKIPGMIELWNFALKKLSEKNTLYTAKTSQIQGIPGFKNHKMLPIMCKFITLNLFDTHFVKFSKKEPISRGNSEFQTISGRFQDWCNFRISRWKSCSRPKTEWKSTLYIEIGKKLAISRRHPEFQKISGSFQEWWNFEILGWKSSFLT